MRHFLNLMICTMLAAGIMGAPAAQAEDCGSLNIQATLDLVPQKNGTVLVPVTIGGERHYFSLGTSAPISSITPALAAHLKLPLQHFVARIVDTAGRVADHTTTVPEFELGGLKATSVKFLVEADRPDAPDSAPITNDMRVGTLGADFLRAYDVDIDFGTNKMNLISNDHCAGKVVYWKSDTLAKLPVTITDNGKIVFPMTLDGHEIETTLSTGTPNTSINLRIASEIYDVDNDTPGNEPAGTLNGTALYAHRFKSLGVEGLSIGNPRIVLLPDLVDDTIRHFHPMRRGTRLIPRLAQLQLGMSTLKHLHIYIAYHEQMLYISPAAPAALPVMPAAVQ